jgi:hypothetical protein
MKMTHMVGLNGIVSIVWVEGIQTTIGRLDDGKTFVDIMEDGERESIVEYKRLRI